MRSALLAVICTLTGSCSDYKKENLIDILILSGKNNHEWQKTTPLLIKIFKGTKLFSVSVTEKPDTLSYNELIKYDVILSNWNAWPENGFRFTEEWENDFQRYVTGGGGVIFFHAGASSFYGWSEFHQMGIGRWGKETSHGKPARAKVYGFNQDHPITSGFSDFFIVDEIWEKTEIYPDVQPLAFVKATGEEDGHQIEEPAVFVNPIEKGRAFFTILGHDERALLNSGLQTLILRAAQWCAKSKVTIEQPPELMKPEGRINNRFNWIITDTSFSLRNHTQTVWQFNYNNRFGKPYFHPLTVNKTNLTCVSPSDHPWHLGLWFSWKFINGKNYWEYIENYRSEEKGFRSEGITSVQKAQIDKNEDFSADIRMDILYHPADGEPVMSGKCNIHVSAPSSDGSYYIDYDNIFFPLTDEVILDRTPIEGQPGGQSWGGYGGLSVRFSQDFTYPFLMASDECNNYKKGSWLYMGFNTLTGDSAGICIMTDPLYSTSQTSWYVINDQEMPFFYFSPAILYDRNIRLNREEQLKLKYRIWILPGNQEEAAIRIKYDSYIYNSLL